MKPEVDYVLRMIVDRLGTETLPALPTPYLQGNLGMMAAILAATSEQWDNAAAWRIEENAALRALFGKAASRLGETAQRFDDAAREPEIIDYRISALNAENDRLRAELIALHAIVEEIEGPAAREIEAEIWREIVAGANRRRVAATTA